MFFAKGEEGFVEEKEQGMSKEYVELLQRIEALEKQYPPLTTIEARIAALENSVDSLKLCTPPPEVESVRCDGNQTAFVGHRELVGKRFDSGVA